MKYFRHEIRIPFLVLVLIKSVISKSLKNNCLQEKVSESSSNNIGFVTGLGSALKLFSSCFLQITNYANIELLGIKQPIILTQYFSIKGFSAIYPIEFINSNKSTLRSFKESPKHWQYIQSTIRSNQTFSKSLNCEAYISLFPPTFKQNSAMYLHTSKRRILSTVTAIAYNYVIHKKLKKQIIETVPKYFVLLTSSRKAEDDGIFVGWSDSIYLNSFANIQRYILWWKTCTRRQSTKLRPSVKMISRVMYGCPYCNPCTPFQLFIFENANVLKSSLFLSRIWKLQRIDNVPFWEVFPQANNWEYFIRDIIAEKTIDNDNSRFRTINHLKFTKDEVEVFARAVDPHIIRIIISNSTYDVIEQETWNFYRFKKLPTCGRRRYHENHIPELLASTHEYSMEYQLTSLMFRRTTKRFISCHKLERSYFAPLLEIVAPIDTMTWVCLSIFSIIQVIIFNIELNEQKSDFDIKLYFKTMMDSMFKLFCGLIDQGANMLSNLASKHLFHFFLLFPIPICYMVLGYEYKGDNIYRLTVTPPLYPFDTFESLVENNFTIKSEAVFLSEMKNKNISSLWIKEFGSNHVSHGAMSNLLYDYLVLYSDTLLYPERLYSKLTKTSREYLNHTALFKNWNEIENDMDQDEFLEKLAIPHMFSCTKAAVIVSPNFGTLMWNNMSRQNMPVYLSQENVHEYYEGYELQATVPIKAYERMKQVFESGIMISWKRIIDCLITRAGQTFTLDENVEEKIMQEEKSLLVFFILIIGYTVAAITFITLENRPKSSNVRMLKFSFASATKRFCEKISVLRCHRKI